MTKTLSVLALVVALVAFLAPSSAVAAGKSGKGKPSHAGGKGGGKGKPEKAGGPSESKKPEKAGRKDEADKDEKSEKDEKSGKGGKKDDADEDDDDAEGAEKAGKSGKSKPSGESAERGRRGKDGDDDEDDRDHDVDRGDDESGKGPKNRPPGWDRGRKTGWGDSDYPPGWDRKTDEQKKAWTADLAATRDTVGKHARLEGLTAEQATAMQAAVERLARQGKDMRRLKARAIETVRARKSAKDLLADYGVKATD